MSAAQASEEARKAQSVPAGSRTSSSKRSAKTKGGAETKGIPDSFDRWAERRIHEYNPSKPEVDRMLKVYHLEWPDTPRVRLRPATQNKTLACTW
eukprot:6213532-Pleurochrysis_carterae.AAC.3